MHDTESLATPLRSDSAAKAGSLGRSRLMRPHRSAPALPVRSAAPQRAAGAADAGAAGCVSETAPCMSRRNPSSVSRARDHLGDVAEFGRLALDGAVTTSKALPVRALRHLGGVFLAEAAQGRSHPRRAHSRPRRAGCRRARCSVSGIEVAPALAVASFRSARPPRASAAPPTGCRRADGSPRGPCMPAITSSANSWRPMSDSARASSSSRWLRISFERSALRRRAQRPDARSGLRFSR